MALSAAQLKILTAHEWLHFFEEDAAGDEIYRPAADAVPSARRPRERLRLGADGSAHVSVGGPDDRSRALGATWITDGNDVVVRVTSTPTTRSSYRIVTIEHDRLVVRAS